MHSFKRELEDSVSYLLKKFPVVVVVGARQTGKTTLIKGLVPDAPFFDLERESDKRRIQDDPEFFFSEYDETLLIDEAQLAPEIFPALRVRVDENRERSGQFLISGSSSPDLETAVNESLAGRVAIINLGTLTLAERNRLPPSPFFEIVENGTLQDLKSLGVRLEREQVRDAFFLGGYPEVCLEEDSKARDVWFENYINTYINRDVRRLFPGINIDRYKTLISMLAFSTSEVVNLSSIAASLNVSQPTVRDYIEIIEKTYLWRKIPSYESSLYKRVAKQPKGSLRDFGLCNFLNHIYSIEHLRANPRVGYLFEGFVVEEILKGFSNRLTRIDYSFFRTSNKSEIDLILEGKFGILPIEVKYGINTDPRRLRVLNEFVTRNELELGLVINNSDKVVMLSKNIMQIPLGCL